jgi:hypothetical protein
MDSDQSNRKGRSALRRRAVSMTAAAAVVLGMASGVLAVQPAAAVVGQGFTVSAPDLAYILQQIKIAEFHASNTTAATKACGALLGNGPNQIPSPLLSFGLRTVDGSCNNLQADQENFGASSQTFPRLTTPVFKDAEGVAANALGQGSPAVASSSYAQTTGSVFDTEPRTISNLIVDQTSTNPAAVAAAGFPVRTQGNDGVVPCTTDPTPTTPGDPAGCVPSNETLFIPNVTTDVGLSPPFNGLFTIFGQFFDHGLDKITNGGAGTVFVPLKADDPLITRGPDGIPNNGDEVPADARFMTLSRGKIVPGADGHRNALNTDTPFVDQSQTYTSNASHQFFLRQYTADGAGRPVATGRFLDRTGDDHGLANWKEIKAQAAARLGIVLQDGDVNDVPQVVTDPYGNFLPGPNGMPVYQTTTPGVVIEGSTTTPIPTANLKRIGIAFLNDIAHSAAPTVHVSCANVPPGPPQPCLQPGDPLIGQLFPDDDTTAGGSLDPVTPAGSYDDELLDQHFICGDGRCNENIALSAIHQVFHSEHNRLIGDITATLDKPENAALKAAYQAVNPAAGPTKTFAFGERLFQAARFVTEMQYQHLVFEEFARKVQPAINPFEPFAFNQTDLNPAITAEFAHAVYRFGHSMLTETIDRVNADGSHNDIPLLDGFLNPGAYHDGGAAGTLNSKAAATSIFMGMSDQTGNEIDEFVTNVLRNNLLGLPLDLPAINMTRARSEGIPPLNEVRRQIFAASNDGQLVPYTNWLDVRQHLKHPESLINFIAAYGTHQTILDAQTLEAKREAARVIVDPQTNDSPPPDAADFLMGTAYPGVAAQPATAEQLVFAWSGTPVDFTLTGTGGASATITPDTTVADLEIALDAVTSGVTVTGGPNAGNGFVVTYDATGPVADLVSSVPELTIGNGSVQGSAAVTAIAAKDWQNTAAGVTRTGVDKIDLWVGGLAEKTNPFGGLLGTTFNYVFEKQLTDLQNGDRFYYLARTPGMNLRAQLEGNSFAELVMRNTDARTLKADPFATADCKFELGSNPGIAAPINGTRVTDDPNSGCDESLVLFRQPDGTIVYQDRNAVDPPGINAQAVYNGTSGVNKILGGNDNDTFWGGDGNDRIDGGSGDDIALGGEGNDIIVDEAGADVPKGGPGNDALNGGIGDDILMGGDGDDFTDGGGNLNEAFLGAGNDYAIAGTGTDAVFGDSGDDWEEGGDQPDLLIGDSSTLFFDDHNQPGHDVLVGQGGDDDYDMEGGDDIGVGGPGVEKNAGAAGYDWITGVGDPQPQFQDLALPIVNAPPANETRDRFNELEALSGWKFNDILRGDDIVPSQVGGGGFIGCDALDADGVARIRGLDTLITPAMRTVDAATVTANAVTSYCGITNDPGPTGSPADDTFTWGEGNILLGGAGSDLLEGRGADDVIDGDRWLNVRIAVVNAAGAEIGSTDLMEHQALTGNFGPGTAGKTLHQAVFAGQVDPGNLRVVRELVLATDAVDCPADDAAPVPATAKNCDVAVFSGPVTNYTISTAGGVTTVTDTTGTDGVDQLRNVERLLFAGTPAQVPGAPTQVAAVAGSGSAVVSFLAPAVDGGAVVTGFQVDALDANGAVVATATGAASPITVNGLTNGVPVSFRVRAVNVVGAGPNSVASAVVTPVGATAPAAPTISSATGLDGFVRVVFVAGANGGSPITGFQVDAFNGTTLVSTTPVNSATAVSADVLGLTVGTSYTFRVRATNGIGTGPSSAPSAAVLAVSRPAAPTIGLASVSLGQVLVTWTPPVNTGGLALTGYQVDHLVGGVVQGSTNVPNGAATSINPLGLVSGTQYTFRVSARNAVGTSTPSGTSNAVTAAVAPGAPTIGTATAGNGQATVTWTPPATTGGVALASYQVEARIAGVPFSITSVPAPATSGTVTGLANGTAYTFVVRAVNAANIASPNSAASNQVTPVAPTAPGAPAIGTALRGNASATVRWTAPASNGGSNITGYQVQVLRSGTNTQVGALRPAGGSATSLVVTGLANGTAYQFQVRAINAIGTGGYSARSNAITPATVPGAPAIGPATSGTAGGAVNARATWSAPASTGGSAVTGYRVIAIRVSDGAETTGALLGSGIRAYVFPGLANGVTYRFRVVAINAVGTSARSGQSNVVTAR